MRKVLLLALLLSSSLVVKLCFARPVRDFYIDTDTDECPIIAVAKISEISLRTKAAKFGQFTVDELNISISVIIPIKGQIGESQELIFLHRRANCAKTSNVPPNGFGSFEFQPGDNYLLFLKEGQSELLELAAPEGFSIARFSDELLGSLKNVLLKDSTIERVIDILLASFLNKEESPSDSLKSLSLLLGSKAFRPYIEQENLKKKCVKRLIEIKETTNKWGTLGGVYYYLSRLGEQAEVAEIVDYILDSSHSKSDRFNAMEWLKRYPEDVQIETLRQIVDNCQEECVLKSAKERLKKKLELLWNLPPNIEREFQCLLNPNCDFSERQFINLLAEFAPSPKMFARSVPAKESEISRQNEHRKVIFRLKEAMKSEFLTVRIRAAQVLDSFGDKSGVEVMIEDMTAEDPNDRANVTAALRIMRDKRVIAVLVKAVDDPSPYVRCIALSALGELQAAEAYEVIALHLNDKEAPAKTDVAMSPAQSACYALGLLGNRNAVPALIEALGDKDLADTACKALRRIKGGDSPFGRGLKGHSEEPGCDAEKWTQWWQWENLNGKAVQVRVYRNWKDDSAGFEIVPLSLKKHTLEFDSVNADSSAAVAVVAEDQDNETIRKVLQDRVYAWPYKKGLNFQLPHYSEKQESHWWFFDDALGNLMDGATVEIFLYDYKGPKIKIGETETDGSLKKLVPQRFLRQFEFIVSHPDYGIAKVTGPYHNKSHIFAPLVSTNSQAVDRAIWGFVLDTKNNPVEAAEILCTNVRTLGEGLINPKPSADRSVALTDENGFFSLYMPPSDQFQDQRGRLIPPKSKYHIRLKAPQELGLRPVNIAVENGHETTIVMEYLDITETFQGLADVADASFRTLVFIGEDGPIIEPDELKLIGVTIHRLNKPKIELKYKDWKDGGLFPNGTYEATMWDFPSASSIKFETLHVTDNSTDKLVFEMPLVTYYGQIVNGITDGPMDGAFVIAMRSTSKGNLSMITSEQWNQLHTLGNNPSPNDPALEPLRKIYGFNKIVRTDEDGRFEIVCPIGENPYGFVCFEENYIGIMHRKYNLKIDEDRYAQVPVKKLYPAAKVYVEPYVKQGRASIMPKWIIKKDDNPQWVSTLLALDDRRESLFIYDKWLKQNSRQSFYVPAGVNLQVELCTPYESQWCPFTFPETINLAHGETLDLGKCTFETALKIFVKVVNSSGIPVEGVPVRKSGSVAHNTDENGIVEFNIPPYSKGDFVVTYWGEDDEHLHLRESIPYEIAGPEDESSQYLFQLSDDMLYHLFK